MYVRNKRLGGIAARPETRQLGKQSLPVSDRTEIIMKRVPVIVLDNGASSIKVGVTTLPKKVR